MSERAIKVLRYIDAVEADPSYYLAASAEEAVELLRRQSDQLQGWKELLDLSRYRQPENRFLDGTMILIGVATVWFLIVVVAVAAVSR